MIGKMSRILILVLLVLIVISSNAAFAESDFQATPFTCVQYIQLPTADHWPVFVPYGSHDAWLIDPFLMGELSSNGVLPPPDGYARIAYPQLEGDVTPTAGYQVRYLTAVGEIHPVSSCEPSISFWAESAEVFQGQCTTLRWDVENVDAIYLNGTGVVGHGAQKVCPTGSTTYTLRILTYIGEVSRFVTVNVTHPAPTSTPIPSPTPTEQPITTPIIRVRNSWINLRSGPGTHYTVAGKAAPGTRLPIVGRNTDNNWWQVYYANGQKLWVAAWIVDVFGPLAQVPIVKAQYLPSPTPEQGSAEHPYIRIRGYRTNVRSGPGTNYQIIDKANPYAQLSITGVSKDKSWWQICCIDDQKAWVAVRVVDAFGDLTQVPIVDSSTKSIITTPTPLPKTTTYSINGLRLTPDVPVQYKPVTLKLVVNVHGPFPKSIKDFNVRLNLLDRQGGVVEQYTYSPSSQYDVSLLPGKKAASDLYFDQLILTINDIRFKHWTDEGTLDILFIPQVSENMAYVRTARKISIKSDPNAKARCAAFVGKKLSVISPWKIKFLLMGFGYGAEAFSCETTSCLVNETVDLLEHVPEMVGKEVIASIVAIKETVQIDMNGAEDCYNLMQK